MKFDPAFIEKVRDANNLVDVISEYTQLKGGGGRMMGLCPFPGHREKSPSFSVSVDKQVYHCFGCKESGNIYTFVQKMKGLSFPESVEYLADKASIVIPQEMRVQSSGPLDQEKREKQSLYKINQWASEYFHELFLKSPATQKHREYAHSRGLTRETVTQFRVGASVEDWEGLAHYLAKRQAPLELAERAGLLRRRPKGSGYYDLFRSRLMFPIDSVTGHCVGFGGRVIGDGGPKYLNSPESLIFSKGRTFYGLNETAKYIRESDQVIVVEGYMDLLALYQSGIRHVVATLGTALTRDHARLIARYTRNVVVLFDGDEAGFSAAERSLPILLAEGLVPRHLLIPNGQDPDDFVRQVGAKEFLAQLEVAPELFHQVLNHHFKGYHGQAGEKVHIVDVIKPIVGEIKDQRLNDLYLQEVSDRLQVTPQWLKRALADSKGAPPASPQAAAENRGPQPTSPLTAPTSSRVLENEGLETTVVVEKPPRAELFLLNLALLREEHLTKIEESGIVEDFLNEGLKEITRRALASYRQGVRPFDKLAAYLTSVVVPASIVSVHLDKAWVEMDREGESKLLQDCIRKVRGARLRVRAREKIAGLRGQSPSEQRQNLEQIVNIQTDRHNLHKDLD